ncbi:phosphatase PAP2 family protein [Leeia aquatica]|uniref:Inositol phosphorylceramide synthase n=1 Tax=Leeia aquatica TaxID=2725557 RepID=A0A847SKH7_9NEIS|nr:phosphatase PAP2 family protein [Leeia aquatica]NLR76432.1 hypothetical protein [Leeia aquatica]
MQHHNDMKLVMLAWLHMLLLGGLFFVGYPLTNQWASHQQAAVLTTPLDRLIPFWGWMIFPYLSINLLYPCSFFLHPDRHSLKRFSLQLLLVQGASLLVFWLYPTTHALPRPSTTGFAGLLLTQLQQFDRPYNMLPSLHVAVLAVLWHHPLRQQLPWGGRLVWHTVALLILCSTLLTRQHQLLDVLAGLAVGGLGLALFPYRPPVRGE